MTREAMRLSLAILVTEMDNAIKYERSSNVTLDLRIIERWKKKLHELEEDELLWK